MIQILAEIKKASMRKSASGDSVYQLILECEDDQIMDLGKLLAQTLVVVTITQEGEDE